MRAKGIYSAQITLVSFIFTALVFGCCVFAEAQTENNGTSIEESSQIKEEDKKIEEAKKEAEDAKLEAEAAEKESELHRKTVEIEKKRAAVEAKEALAAKKEAEIAQKDGGTEARKAVEKAQKEEAEAKAAFKRIALAQEKADIAEEKAQVIKEELTVAEEMALLAETKARERKSIIYSKLIQTGMVIFFGYLLIFMIVGVINRRIKEIKVRHVVRKNTVYLLNFLIILFVVFIWLQDINSITIIFSVMGAGVALALQEAILCIAGWLLILVRRPYEAGDRIELGGVKGDVIDIRLFQTSLLEIGNWVEADQSTGRIVNVPNSAVFKKENYNYSRGFEYIWNEIKILVTFESDWKLAEEIMMKHASKYSEGMEDIIKRKIEVMSRSYMIYFEKFKPITYVDIKDSGVELSLRYLTEAKKRRTTQDSLSREILNDFEKEEKVNFAYPTYRIVK